MGRRQRRAGDERGAVLVFVAIAMVMVIGSAALAIDVGRETVRNRHIESVADVVALDAVRAINGQTVSQLSGSSGAVTVAVQASATRNNFPYGQLAVDLGTFANGTFTRQDPVSNPSAIPTAVRVAASETTNFLFARGGVTGSRGSSGGGSPGNPTPCGSGVACAVKESSAGFSIGSFLIGTTGAQDTVLNCIFGDSFHAQVLSYNGLASANVTTSLRKLGLNMPVTVLSPTQLLNTSVSAKNLMLASAAALNDGSHATAVSVLNSLATSVTTTTMVKLGDFIKVQAGGEAAAADAEMNVLQMLTAAAFVVDGSHAISIPQAQVNVAGIAGVTLSLDVISPAQWAYGPVGTSASNSQVNLTITPQIHVTTSPTVNGCSLKSTLLSLLSLSVGELVQCTLGNTVSRVVSLDLNASIPIDLSVAKASATLSTITCTSPQSITLSPTISPLTVNSNIDMTLTGTLLGNSLGNVLRVRADAGVVSQSSPAPVSFQHPSEFGTPKTVTSNSLALAGLTNLTVSDALLLNANLGPVSSVLGAAAVIPINAAFNALDTGLITPLVHGLGLGIGGADLTALTGSLECDKVRLAG